MLNRLLFSIICLGFFLPLDARSEGSTSKELQAAVRAEIQRALSSKEDNPLKQLIRDEIKKLSVTDSQTVGSLDSQMVGNTEAATSPISDDSAASVEQNLAKVPSKSTSKKIPFEFELSGYGDMRFSHYDYDENITQNEGSRSNSSNAFDLSRFVVNIEGEYQPAEVGFEAEVEFEHGGTGTTKELEFEEFGEFEDEIENGGEVILEELYLWKKFGDRFKVRAGRFYVGVGLLSNCYRPTDYLAVSRSEAETTLLPAVWDEIGVSLEKKFDWGKITLQAVNGLDSSGFSSAEWIASGHQEKFEVNRAEDLAYVARLDLKPSPDLLFGGSIYYAASTSGNRPRADLDQDGKLLILSSHAVLDYENWQAKGVFIWGSLDDSAEISDRNSRLSNNLGVQRTPVAEEAMAWWGEVGYDCAPALNVSGQHEIVPFFRFDYYDTFYQAASGVFANPRFERTVYTAGLAYTYMNSITTKLDWSYREFGGNGIDEQNVIRLGLGFIY